MPPSNMSVFQRGGNYLHRHLTKLYSDTKQSYETATVASKTTADEDPILKALHREFRVQKDRLLAWGLQWSDSNAAPSPDVEIDQKLDQAGLGHVVALVMSDIQKLLIESEMIQNPHTTFQRKMSAGHMDAKTSNGKNDLTSDDIAKSRSLLSQLVTCIDSLYKLSESRRSLSTSSQMEKASKESLAKDHSVSMSPSSSQAQDFRSFSEVAGNEKHIEEFVRRYELFIDSSYINFAFGPTPESEKPPPYEEVMPLEKTRLSGTLEVSKLSREQLSALKIEDLSPKDVVVEYVPTGPDGGNALADQYCTALRHATQIFERQSSPEVSHTGVLRLLGYTIDVGNARHGFVYELPGEQVHRLEASCSNLRAIIPSKRDDSDTPSPHLDDRFRLAFNILLNLLHLSIQGLRHNDFNSTNVLILLDRPMTQDGSGKSGISPFDIRRPYLLHSPPSAEIPGLTSGPLSAIYRHANDTNAHKYGRSWAFDIYSFGLILLEIGLWTPVSRLWKPKYNKATFTSRIKSIYVPKLASRCGTAYMKVVQTCINTPDIFEADSSNARSRETDQIWCSYMIQIGRDLARCCAIDLDGSPCEPDLARFERLNDERSSVESPRDLNDTDSPPTSSGLPSISTATAEAKCGARTDLEPNALSQAQQTILKKWNNVDIPQECLDQWNNYLMPRVSKLLQKALDSSRESCSASLMMVGRTPETAKTTICIQCTSVDKVRDCLRRNFRCKNGWGLVILRGDVRRSGKARRKRKSQEGARSRLQPPQPEKSAYQQRPQFGASIGAFRSNEHLPPVSFGGAILVDGKPYGMTVHHMLDAPSDDEDEVPEDATPENEAEIVQRSAAHGSDAWLPDLDAQHPGPQRDEFPGISEVLEISDDESECSTIRPDYVDLETGNGGFWFAGDVEDTPGLDDDLESDSDSEGSSDVDEDGDEDDRVSVGDTSGIDPADDEEVYVTQPAIDDVDDDFFPCVEDRDDDHLASHSLGYVHASSGIRRVVTGNVKHEVDWALIKIRDERLALGNTIHQHLTKSKRSRRAKEKSIPAPSSSSSPNPPASTHLTTIASCSALPRLPVHCHGRTSGLQCGHISPALALVKLHGRTSFSSSWVVEGGGFGIPGDSGAWIYDPLNGSLCGHVLAWGRQSKTAYMAPMEVLFEDIRRRLGADRVELPGRTEDLAGDASKQLHRSEVDLLQEGIRTLHLPRASGELEPDHRDRDVHMGEEAGPVFGSSGSRLITTTTKATRGRPIELAISTLQIDDPRVQRTEPLPPCSPIRRGKGLDKDLPATPNATPNSLSPWALGAIESLCR
jgi:hypothetical protein